MSGLPPRPKPGYMPGCSVCDHRRDFDGGIACHDHRTDAERAWYAEVERISAAPVWVPPNPTLF